MTVPQFILLEARDAGSDALAAYARDIESTLAEHAGQLILRASAEEAAVLEIGSEPHAVVVLKFPSAETANRFATTEPARRALNALATDPGFLHAVSLPGIPEEGLPDAPIPTTANVSIPDLPGHRGYMLVQGTVSDPDPIGRYMEIIVPLIIERGGVYRVWTDPTGPELLAGNWPAQYVVFSEWPNVDLARDMWFSDAYQNEAIPTRQPASDFTVLLFQGNA